jgi:hypothetical protein
MTNEEKNRAAREAAFAQTDRMLELAFIAKLDAAREQNRVVREAAIARAKQNSATKKVKTHIQRVTKWWWRLDRDNYNIEKVSHQHQNRFDCDVDDDDFDPEDFTTPDWVYFDTEREAQSACARLLESNIDFMQFLLDKTKKWLSERTNQ